MNQFSALNVTGQG